jgi:hypothetical protein
MYHTVLYTLSLELLRNVCICVGDVGLLRLRFLVGWPALRYQAGPAGSCRWCEHRHGWVLAVSGRHNHHRPPTVRPLPPATKRKASLLSARNGARAPDRVSCSDLSLHFHRQGLQAENYSKTHPVYFRRKSPAYY